MHLDKELSDKLKDKLWDLYCAANPMALGLLFNTAPHKKLETNHCLTKEEVEQIIMKFKIEFG